MMIPKRDSDSELKVPSDYQLFIWVSLHVNKKFGSSEAKKIACH